MNTTQPLDYASMKRLLEHLIASNQRFLLLERKPDGQLTYTVQGNLEDIRADLEEFQELLARE